jgi:actin-related protein 8
MGFKQICAQQVSSRLFLNLRSLISLKESLAATYGAGMSNACVVNLGATTTNIACVDEGLIIPDTRYIFGVKIGRELT